MTLINTIGTRFHKLLKNNSPLRTKKDNETVRDFAHKVQQPVEKGWCNENASTINLKCIETFTKGLPKNLKDC